jgi:hypothetical protein
VKHDAAVQAAAKVTLATLAFGGGEPPEWWGAALADFVAAFEPIADAELIELAADVDLRHFRVRLGAPLALRDRGDAWFEHLGLDGSPVDIEDVAPVAGGLPGWWLDMSATDLRSGWDVDVHAGVAASDLWPVLPDTNATRALATWCERASVSVVHRVAVMAGGAGDCEITIGLPGSSIDEQVASAMSLFDHLAVEHLSDDTLGSLSATSRPRLVARIALTPTGVASLGVGAVEPTTESVLVLREAVRRGDDESLAAFEGALGVTDRLHAEVVQQVGGANLRLDYRVA